MDILSRYFGFDDIIHFFQNGELIDQRFNFDKEIQKLYHKFIQLTEINITVTRRDQI